MSRSSFLGDIVEACNKQNDTLGIARNNYLTKEAERKHFEATLVRDAQGKSHAERLINAQATEAWATFAKELARLEAIFEFQKLKYDVLDKEFQAAYLQAKHDAPIIRKGGAA
jgi:hypothetical protein